MKGKTIIFLITAFLLLFTSGKAKAQCPTGDVALNSQTDVNNFATNYPNCTEILGNLYIGGSTITDLSPLSNIQSIGGVLYIYYNSQLTNLDGLSNLTQIGGYLLIRSNSQLTNLDGLSNLTQIGEYLNIHSNSQLTNLDGLSNLTQIGGYLYIQSNSQLTNLDGLSNLTQIGWHLNIQSNSQLTNLDGLSALESINGDLIIYNNAVLTDISGLQNIDPATILPNSYGLYIQNNPLLSVCNLDNFCTYLAGSGLRTISGNAGDCVSVTAVTTACTTSQEPQCPTGDVALFSQADVNNFATNYPNCTEITGYLYIGGSTITDLSPLSNIQSVGGYLAIYLNSQLTNLDGLSNLTEIGGYLNINNNSQLTNLDGLSNLTQIGGYLFIYNNSQLTNLDGLGNLTQIGGYLDISYNSQLTNLDGLSNLTSIGADLAIYSNSALTDISGLQNIDSDSILSTYYGVGLYIQNNPLLSVCNLDNFCTYLAGSGSRTISGNAGDCVSVTAVTTACTTSQEPQCPTGDVALYSQTQVNDFGTNYPNCTEITGNVTIQGSNITDLSPLSNIQSIGGYLNIQANSQLTNLDGLSNLTQIGGYLNIQANSQLTNLDGLSNLTQIGGYLNISSNSQLTNLDGLSNLTQIGGYLNIQSNSQLTNLDGLSNLTQIGWYLNIVNNSQLTNLDGLSNLTQIGGYLGISSNSQLANLDGLSALESINGDLVIYNNAVLTDISGLQNIDPATILSTNSLGLYIQNNPLLSVCNLDNFCTYLAGSGLRTISGNAGDCVSVTAVTTACTTSQEPQCPTGDVALYSQTDVNNFATNYPNCTEITGNLYISGSNITDLSPLSNIIAVTGNLYAEHTSQLTSLQGLHNVASVGGSLSIYNNPQLNSVQALSNITSLGGFLSIYNTNLSSLEGLHNITAIDGGLSITSNAVLTDISALENIDPETITDTGLYIAGNSSLSVCDLDNFCTFLQGSGTRTISGNAGNCYESAVTNACLGVISYCIPVAENTSVSYGIYINSFTVTGGETNINNTNSGFSTGGYGNFSDNHSASQMAGESLSFSAVPGNESFRKGLRIWVDWNNDGVFDNTASNSEIVYFSPNVLYETHNGSFTIPSDKPAGNYRMRVMMKYESTIFDPCEINNGAPYYSYFYGETEDYTLTVLEPLPCSSPTALTASNLTINSATIGWTSTGSLFDIEWGLAGFAQGTGTTETGVTTAIYDLSGLEIGTSYDFYVRQDCNAISNGYSYWVKHTFNTINYCIPVPDSTSPTYGIYIGSFTTTGGETNITNTNSGFSANGYGNFSSVHSASQIAGESLSFSVVPGSETYSKGLRIWVDWNNDGVFDNTASNSEIVYVSPNVLYGTHNGSFTIPSDKPAGNYRMRVMMKYNTSSLIDPCEINNGAPYYSYFYGETEDYTLTVIQVSCPAPTALNISNLTMESVAINWTSTGSLFDIEWGIQGFTQGTGTQETGITTTSYILSGLDAVIPYDFYIRQDCNGSSDEYSYWVKYTFSINNYCIPVDSSYSEMHGIFINSFTTIGGETNINNLDSGFSANGYGNFSAIHSVSQFAGESISFSAVPVNEDSNKSFRAWVDWNKDGVFANDNSEIVYASPNMLLSTHTGSFEIPADKTPGNYRMRIIIMHNTHTIDPCETGFYGEAEDYTLTVLNNTSVSCNSYTIWNGTSWSNGEPDSNKKAIIEGNLTITTTLTACELLLNSGVLTVNSSALLTVNGEIVNTQNENNFIVHNDANVIQVEDVENTGAITVKRNAVIKHLDYSTWSSPVLGQKLKAFSPYTLNNRIRIYDAVANTWKIVENPETTDFASGAGYMFRAPNVNDDGFYPNAYTWTGNFKGIPQNGDVAYNFSNATGAGLYQSLGNPYPSNISRASFHTANPQIGTLHFWTNTNAPVNGVYQGNNYATINRSGDAVMVTSNIQGGQNSAIPNGYIAVGQGFVAQTNGVINQAVFTNSMRTAQNATFLRSSNNEKHRFWLNLSKGTQEHNQMLVSYNEEATNDVDFGIDSELFGYTGSALYSLINQNQTKYVIQGRALPFTDIDVVQLGFKATEAGIYKVSLSDFDGTFAENQNIYIKDNQTSTQHNLKLSNYEFASLEGTFNDRFEIVYTDSVLDVSNPEYQNTWIVYKQNDLFHIETQGFEMKEVVVYDMLGRIVYSAKPQGNNHQINGLDTNGVYIVKIITNNNIVLNKKVQ